MTWGPIRFEHVVLLPTKIERVLKLSFRVVSELCPDELVGQKPDCSNS